MMRRRESMFLVFAPLASSLLAFVAVGCGADQSATEAKTSDPMRVKMVVFDGYNGTGNSKSISLPDLDLEGKYYDDEGLDRVVLLNDSIKSINLLPESGATLCPEPTFSDSELFGCIDIENDSPRGIVHNLHAFSPDLTDRVSSIDVRTSRTIWNSHSYYPDYPSRRVNSWSEEAQGLAHDESNWYMAQKWYLLKTANDNLDGFSERISLPPGCTGSAGHFGDPVYYQERIYVPLEGCDSPFPVRMAAYDRDLNLVKLANLVQHTGANAHSAWVAVNPANGLLYTDNRFDPVTNLLVYDLNFEDGQDMSPLYEVILPFPVARLQGGEFSDNGTLYLISDDAWDTSQAGIVLLQIKGKGATYLKKMDPNGYDPSRGDEIEGLTLWNLDRSGVPNVKGQIHWILLNNNPSGDTIDVKHIAVDRPANL